MVADGFQIKGLRAGDICHLIHVDGNLQVADSAAGTVFVNMMVQGTLNISGSLLPSSGRQLPAVALATVVGLGDRDLNVLDDQSVVITDFYSEQIHTGHVYMAGSGKSSTGEGGRVTIAGVKVQAYTANEIYIDNWHGSLTCKYNSFSSFKPSREQTRNSIQLMHRSSHNGAAGPLQTQMPCGACEKAQRR